MKTRISIIAMAVGYAGSAVVTDFSIVPSAICVYPFSYKMDIRYVTCYTILLIVNEIVVLHIYKECSLCIMY